MVTWHLLHWKKARWAALPACVRTNAISTKLLINDRNVRRIEGGFVNYVQIMFDYHEVIWANDYPSESFYAGDQAINTLNTDQVREILAIFLDLRSGTKDLSLALAEAHGY